MTDDGGRVFVTMWGPRKYRGRRGVVLRVGAKRTTVELDGPDPVILKGNRVMFHPLTIHTDEKS